MRVRWQYFSMLLVRTLRYLCDDNTNTPKGYIVIASAQNIGAVAAGIILYAVYVLRPNLVSSCTNRASQWLHVGFREP